MIFPKFFRKNGSINAPHIFRNEKFINSELFKKIDSYIIGDIPINQKVSLILEGKKEVPKCPICNKLPIFNTSFKTYCSTKCQYADENRVNKIKYTKQEKYGDGKYNNRKKSKETCIEKYGTEHYVMSNDFKKKSLSTKQEKYGDGKYNNWKKAEATRINKYGVKYCAQKDFSKETLSKLTKEYLIEQHYVLKKTQKEIALDVGVDGSTISNYLKKFNIEIKYFNNSIPENEIASYIEVKYNTIVQQNVRSIIPPREIDIWVPAFHLAIEFNGFYWHRLELFNGSEKEWLKYHQSKELECNQLGIQLLHLWESYSDIEKLIDNAILAGVVENNYTKVLKELYNIKESL